MRIFIFVILNFCWFVTPGQSQEVPYTQDDRDRMVRLEAKQEYLDDKIDRVERSLSTKIDQAEKGLEDKISLLRDEVSFLANLIVALIVVMFGFVGYLVWDRKTTLKPVKNKQDALIDVLREYAREKNDKTLKKLLDKAAII